MACRRLCCCVRQVSFMQGMQALRFQNRTLLSSAYACHTEWQERLDSQVLKDAKIEELHYGILQSLQKKSKKASALDVDIFANAIKQEKHLDLLEEVVYRFRQGHNNWDLLESTHQAVIRAHLQHDHIEELLEILDSRKQYGIFLDNFMANTLMDHFVKIEDYRSASKVAIQMMLQEELEHPIIRYLALYSCYMNAITPDQMVEEEEEDEVEDESSESKQEDEKEWIWRYAFLKNKHFDDHFDLTSHTKLVGKTLASLTRSKADIVDRSCTVIGLALYQNFSEALQVISDCSGRGEDGTIYLEAVEQLATSLADIGDEECPDKSTHKEKLEELRRKLVENGQIDETENLREAIKQRLGADQLLDQERRDIDDQKKLFAKWIKEREEKLQQQIHDYLKAEKIKEHEEKRKELQAKEEFLTFFDRKIAIEKVLPSLPKIEDLRKEYKMTLDEIYDNYESLLKREEYMKSHRTMQKIGDPKT